MVFPAALFFTAVVICCSADRGLVNSLIVRCILTDMLVKNLAGLMYRIELPAAPRLPHDVNMVGRV